MVLAFRTSRKHRIHKRINKSRKNKNYSRLSRLSTTAKRFQKQNAGASTIIELHITYENNRNSHDAILVSNNQDLTNEYNSGNLSKQPDINILNAEKDKTYLLTLTDPDAPNGEGQTGNHIWTHWVATIKNNILGNLIVPYAPPSPPRGTHRYEFKLYDTSILNGLPSSLADSDERGNYYNNHLAKLIAGKPVVAGMRYKVNSGK